jgi:hypothetical protein
MSQLQRAGQSGALDVAASQAVAKDQVAVIVDMLRQLGGNARVAAGALEAADPLNAPFTLYVDPYIGSDRFVGGAYNSHEATGTDEEIIAQKLKRIELQRLECGYTSARPFKTINRAAIEAAIITSKSWYTYSDPRAHVDCVTIVLSGGVHIVYNDPGSSATNLASWGTAKDPTIADLIAFNPTTGGVLLPRGCSLRGLDLRKTTIRPNWVPAVADEAADYSNRRAILKVSGTGFFFDYSFMDKIGHTESVHLLDAFQPASKAELDAFYAKIQSTVGTGADLANALLVTRASEYQIVGPIDQSQAPTSAWDTTAGASPYIFNVSVRSDYGMGGAFWDGAKLSGLKSMVCANFTGTNQQNDMRCWQAYENGGWVSLSNTTEDYQKYINADPDNVRRNPARQTRHISAINDAYIQKVSIFGIGQSEVTMVDSGGEITDNGGNSTFGGGSALAKGYKGFAFNKDKNWAVSRLRLPLNLSEKTSNVRRIELGVVASVSSSAITLTNGLAIGGSASNPAILESLGYSFASGTRIWIDNPSGADWRATLSSSAWSSSAPTSIGITAAPLQAGTNEAAGNAVVGRRVYLRRVVDTRTVAERRLSLILNNTASARLPQRNTVLQTDPNRSNGAISRVLAAGGEEVLLVTASGKGPLPGSGVTRTAEVTIRRGAPSKVYASGTFYRQGTVVKHAGKHWQAVQDLISSGAAPDPALWGETFVHMPSDFNPEDSVNQEAPILVLDTDTSDADDSTTLGINWSTIWTSAGAVRDQYRTGTDYLGAYGFLRALGFTESAAHAALVPQAAAARDRDPSSSADFPTAPSGGAATGLGNWAVEFRRPSTIRLYNHQWEWAGFGNYSKAMPAVQQDMSEFNRFTYYFTNAAGGRVTPKGSNEDGFEVTPKGLEDIATGATISPESLGGQTLDEAQRTDFPNGIQVGGTAQLQDVVITGNAEFGSQSQAKTTKAGAVELASIAQLTEIPGSVASTDAALEGAPEVVTIAGLNRWRQAQRLVSAATGTVTIYVQSTAADRDLNSMFDTPPTAPAAAIPTLARAAEYANAVIGSGNQTAEVRIAPGLYDPASVWQCNVVFRASDASQADWPLIFTETGDAATAENWFDGSGYGNLTTRVNFRAFTLTLRDGVSDLHVLCIGRQIRCSSGVDFRGGFHLLGIPELIKLVADQYAISTTAGDAAQRLFHVVQTPTNTSGSVLLPSSAFTTNTATNVDTFLSALRSANNRNGSSSNPAYESWTSSAPIQLEGGTADVADLRGIMFGPALPSHKESLGGSRSPYIATNGLVQLRLSNLYLRGNASVTSAGAGVTNAVPDSGSAHYGSASVATPWTWRQFHHTFIGSISDQPVSIEQMGDRISYLQDPNVSASRSWYRNSTDTRYLANHIHLLTSAGAEPIDNDSGPFLDQFIHAKRSLTVRNSFLTSFSASSTGNVTQGFVGRFGSNGYNSVKARGVLLGNEGLLDQERGGTVFLGWSVRLAGGADNTALSIFKVAGLAINQGTQTLPKYGIDINLAAAGVTYQILSLGNTSQTDWNTLAGTSGVTYAVGSRITAAVNGSTLANTTGAVEPFYGEPHPLGASTRRYNPVITTAALNQADGTFALNMALRSYARGISPEHGFNITPNVVL